MRISVVGIMFFLFWGCGAEKEISIAGKTMGTTYHIKVVTTELSLISELKNEIDRRLDEINRSMSTYLADSEISRFNRVTRLEKFTVSKDFMQVAKAAAELYRLSEGAWDATVMPLVGLWGFGSTGQKRIIPAAETISACLKNVGFHYIEFPDNGSLKKQNPALSLDFASIAKGYGVDQISALLRSRGIENFLVEIGGEVYAAGFKKNGDPWRVGINYPHRDAPADKVYRIVTLHDRAMATSGDYRNFFEVGGRYFSHVLDPRTGYPVSNRVVSVSVTSPSCMLADGLATAVMVMGPEKGIDLINRLADTECLVVVNRVDGTLEAYYSSGIKHEIKNG